MEFKKQTTACAVKHCIFDSTSEQPIDSDIMLPEYYPDVVRVLKCSLTPQIFSVQTKESGITAEGGALLRILYLSEENTVRCFEQNLSFQRTAECNLPPQAQGSVCANTEYVNCRVVSPRKLDIHGALSLHFEAVQLKTEELICACQGAGVETKLQKQEISALLGSTRKIFTMEETLELGDAKPAALQILSSDACAELHSVKLVSGKALLKGELQIQTVYLGEGETESLQTMQHTVPISQIVEIEGAEDGAEADVSLSVTALQLSPKPDSSGAMRLLHAYASVEATLDIYKDMEETLLSDAYSTEYEIQSTPKSLTLQKICDKFTDTYLCRGQVDISGSTLKEVLNVRCTNFSYQFTVKDGKLHIDGTADIEILYKNAEGLWGILERKLEAHYARNISVPCGEAISVPHITLGGMDYLLNAEEHMEIRLEMEIEALIFSAQTVQVLSDIAVNTENRKNKDSAALTVYFANAGETLWDIARQYNTTVEAIRHENGMSGDALEEKCTLLIPRV